MRRCWSHHRIRPQLRRVSPQHPQRVTKINAHFFKPQGQWCPWERRMRQGLAVRGRTSARGRGGERKRRHVE
jgi:hypothetical protein